MIKEQRKYCYGVYTLMFFTDVYRGISAIFTEGKALYGEQGVEDGLSQHFSALAYYGEALREFSVIFWQDTKTCDVGYESWVWCRYPLNIELLCDR